MAYFICFAIQQTLISSAKKLLSADEETANTENR
jgi:hypothetical protein